MSEAGVHRPHVAGIHGREDEGAYSIVLSGGYEDDKVSLLCACLNVCKWHFNPDQVKSMLVFKGAVIYEQAKKC